MLEPGRRAESPRAGAPRIESPRGGIGILRRRRSTAATSTAPPPARDDAGAPVDTTSPLQVGGSIKAPTKIRDVRPVFDEAAMDAVRQWQFTPTLLNALPGSIVMTMTVNFTQQQD